MGKNNIPLMSHIDSVMAKIAADKKAELGSTSFTSPGDGNTKPKDGGTYNNLKKNVNANAETANVGDANKNPGGEHAGSVAPILTSDDKSTMKVKSGKDVGDTAGPKATDQGSCKSAELANALLASIAELTKSAGDKKAEDKKPEDKKSTEGTDVKVEVPKDPKTGVELTEEEKKAALLVKEAAEKFPEAMAGGYAFAQKVASLLVDEADRSDPAQTKVAAEAENDAIKVAEFLLGFTKTANEDMAALLGGAGGGAGAVVPPEAAMAGGADLAGGMPGAEGAGSEEQIIQALADALQAQGITPEQLAEALAAEQGAGAAGGAPAGGMDALPNGGDSAGAAHEAKETPAEEEAEEEAKKPEAKEDSAEKEAALRKTAGYKTASQQVSDRLAELRKKGLLKAKK